MNAVSTEPAVAAARHRCDMNEVFASPFIELISLAPRNPVVRGLILAQTGRMPGMEHQTFEQIRDWVETTCEKKMRPKHQPPVRAAEGIAVTVEFSETEHGRANYSVNRSGSDEFALDADELLQIVQDVIDDGEGIAELVEKIAEEIEDDAWNRCEPSLEDYGDNEYEGHEADDTSNVAVEFSRVQIRERLAAFLRERHPQLLEELT